MEFTKNTLLLQIFLEERLQKLKVHHPLKIFLLLLLLSRFGRVQLCATP